ncbi:LlaJI family restriction endonuclease [Bifidobacterium ramosum]|uniref:LlaJI family restriction endonuclease n=1 Tax=Bifidobacterium ramosum TaxID=1798158 RepID=A0A6L4WY29_9BIFI|nr:LlaJI family restriction endonuclease [Bifidobacterium ramosum]KAB8287092.1 LlaJI family restriction endonuclease [Bifidobacterium ramosum]NEG71843.1 LlaJI family restriction endonuclease [Bifidobacterium ramosum]
MTSRFFIEGALYTSRQIREAWIVGSFPHYASSTDDVSNTRIDDDVASITNLLASMKIGKKRLLKNVDGGYQFNYVGVIAANGFLFPILPKYYTYLPREDTIPTELASASLSDILAAIRRYFVSHPTQQDELTFSPVATQQSLIQNQLGLYRFLLDDYAQNGPYTNSRRVQELNGEGEIEWPRTIDQTTPIMNNGSPAYMELITSRRTRESSNFIARVQLAILTEISTFIESTGLNGILHMPLVKNSGESLEAIGEVSILELRLRRELNIQFETRKKLLLHNMLNYLEDYSPANRTSILAEGTGSFDRVWEDICKQIFHHDDRITLPKPNWEFFLKLEWNSDSNAVNTVNDMDADETKASTQNTIDTAAAETHSLIPDVINTDQQEDQTSIYILDAKYYIPKYKLDATNSKVGQITGQPGIGDLIKQFFYMMALRQELPLRENKKINGPITILGNALILPSQRTLDSGKNTDERPLLIQRGRVSLKFMTDMGKSMPRYILLFELDAEQAIRMYLNSLPDTSETLEYLHQMFNHASSSSIVPNSIKR